MEAITERVLAEFIANGAVESITIRAVPDGYETHVRMIFAKDDSVWRVVNRDQSPKVWVSLDRLVRHLSQLGAPVVNVDMNTAHGTQQKKRRGSAK